MTLAPPSLAFHSFRTSSSRPPSLPPASQLQLPCCLALVLALALALAGPPCQNDHALFLLLPFILYLAVGSAVVIRKHENSTHGKSPPPHLL
ncbi:hypothetical protein IWX47DRAFT_878909 [Phyllosticta citricarpa]|uniref:Uncharacterized protein n=1 Tax=Phyllosticta citricarpa TaxID=55181 RepID=A0ABR1LJX6_9PEZI